MDFAHGIEYIWSPRWRGLLYLPGKSFSSLMKHIQCANPHPTHSPAHSYLCIGYFLPLSDCPSQLDFLLRLLHRKSNSSLSMKVIRSLTVSLLNAQLFLLLTMANAIVCLANFGNGVSTEFPHSVI